MILRILVGLYLGLRRLRGGRGHHRPQRRPLSAVFLAIAALPWTLALSWVVDRVGELPVWLNLSLMSAGILVNALILYGAGRMLRSVLAR